MPLILVEQMTSFVSRTVKENEGKAKPFDVFSRTVSLPRIHSIRGPTEHTIQPAEVVVCFKSRGGTRRTPSLGDEGACARAFRRELCTGNVSMDQQVATFGCLVCFRLFQVRHSSWLGSL